jgi:MFS family permease
VSIADQAPVRWADIAVIALSVACFAAAVGGTPVLMGVLLKERHYTATFIGISAGMTPLGVMVGAFLSPTWAYVLGAFRFAIGCAAAGVVLLASMAVFDNVYFWLLSRLLWGAAIAGFYIVTKAWIAGLTPPAQRGKVIGAFTTLLAAGFSCGPLLVSSLKFAAYPALAALAGLILLAAAGLALWRRRLPRFQGRARVSVLAFLPMAPVLVLAAGLFGLFDHSTLAFLPGYGLDRGLSLGEAGMAIAALNIGNVVLQVPIGWLADRVRREWVLSGCAFLCALGALLLPVLVGTPLFLSFLMVWGALAYGVATVAVVVLGDHFTNESLLAGSAALTLASGIGGTLGPPLIGAGIDVIGPAFFPGLMGCAFVFLAVVSVLFGGVRVRPAVV